MTEINVVSITQIGPLTVSTATVRIIFQVLGQMPDNVQVYATGASSEMGQLVQTVDINSHDPDNSTQFDLQAGTEYFFHLCPRTTTAGIPDNEMDGKPWETFCTAALSFTTHAAPGPPIGDPKPLPPVINSFQTTPATLTGDAHIVVFWSEPSVGVDQFHIMWAPKGGGFSNAEVSAKDAGGRFSAGPVRPNITYEFKMQGCITKLIGDNICSDFSQPKSFTMPPFTHSLRTFLVDSGVDLGRTVGLKSVNTAHIRSLRALMKL